jgi:anti-sigma regulatory factor (Ser/Thr protein kinase)
MVARAWEFQADEAREAVTERHRYLDFLRAACTPDSDYDGALIVFAELIANVIRHAAGPIRVIVRADEVGTVTLQVMDSGAPFALTLSLPPSENESGRGLYIVSQLCGEVSVSRNEDGNVVKVRLPVALMTVAP